MKQHLAMTFAIRAHESVNHLYDGHNYAVHLIMVTQAANQFMGGIIPEHAQADVLAACWLHDTIEDCRLTYNDIKDKFGIDIAEIVYALTNDKGKTRADRAGENYYRGIRNTSWATFVKMCDRLANIRYSKTANSRMLDVYRKEHTEFIDKLIKKQGSGEYHYRKMISEMESLLEVQTELQINTIKEL